MLVIDIDIFQKETKCTFMKTSLELNNSLIILEVVEELFEEV